MPRDRDGGYTLNPRPSEAAGSWFQYQNDGGWNADPTRAQNCVDCTLSFLETWAHGRPRVSAPRTFDGYAGGDPNRVSSGEWGGVQRMQAATGGPFQSLTPPYPANPSPQQIKATVDQAFNDLAAELARKGRDRPR